MLLAVTQPNATLWAAFVAAVASLASLVLNLMAGRRAEMRAAHRVTLLPHLESLGESIHQTLATSMMLRQRALNGQDRTKWIEAGEVGAATLKTLRPQVRYALPGVEEPLRVISRLPNWIATYRDVDDGDAEQLLRHARELQVGVDAAIRRSYRTGLPPGRIAKVASRSQGLYRPHHLEQAIRGARVGIPKVLAARRTCYRAR